MTDARQLELFGAGKPYGKPALLPPLVRFVVSGLWVAAVFWGSGFVYALFPGRNLLPGLLFRLIACLLTGAGFIFFLRVLDYNELPLLLALGLPWDGRGGRQWISGNCPGRAADHGRRAVHRLVRFAALSTPPYAARFCARRRRGAAAAVWSRCRKSSLFAAIRSRSSPKPWGHSGR